MIKIIPIKEARWIVEFHPIGKKWVFYAFSDESYLRIESELCYNSLPSIRSAWSVIAKKNRIKDYSTRSYNEKGIMISKIKKVCEE